MAVGPVARVLALRPAGPSLWTWLAVGIATVLAVPIAAVVSSLTVPAGDVWLHLWRTQLLELVGQTLLLLAGVGTGTLVVGGGLAWLVVHHRFPGRGVLEWAFEAKPGEARDIAFACRVRWPKDKGVVMVPAG